ncbi:MAG: PKD domain-containing protein [Bacteroidetes bacterium]|nr:PKD domain-containing protein [Bacteroidota bacterium]
MRTFLSIVCLMLLISFTLSAKNEKLIPLNSGSENGLKIIQKNETSLVLGNAIPSLKTIESEKGEEGFIELLIEGYSNVYNIGKPQLPVMNRLIEVPHNAHIQINILSYDEEIIDLDGLGITDKIIPCQPSYSKSADPSEMYFRFDETTYSTDAFNEDEMVSSQIKGFMRGVRIGKITVSPLRYNPVRNILKIYNNIRFEIVFENADLARTEQMKKKFHSPLFESTYNRLINYESPATKDGITSYPITYIIVSDPMFETALQTFIEWKVKKGFKVIEGYTDVIGSTTSAIKTWLQNLYNTETPTPTFVLFEGDVAQIPAYNTTTGSSHVTDLHYCEFTGDYIPELYYGRFSAENTTELQNIIDKILPYEQYTFQSMDYLDECMLIAGVDNSMAASYGNGQICYGINEYYNTVHGFTDIYAYYYDNTSWPYAVMSSNSAGASNDIINKISGGLGFANYSAHCSSDGWADPEFAVSDIAGLANADEYGFLIGNCCQSVKFEESDAFGEEILYANKKGAIGYIGGSDYTYWDEDFYWSVGINQLTINSTNAALHNYSNTSMGAYDGVWHENSEPESDWYITGSQMVFCGNLAITQSSSSSDDYYWEIYHLMGDPSLMPYMSKPDPLTVSYSAAVVVGTTSLVVNTEEYAYVAISRDGVLLDAQYTGTDTYVTMSFAPFTLPGIADVVVTKQNKQPYIGTLTVISSTTPPTADFEADQTTVLAGTTINFTDLSLDYPTSWTWSFPGGSPLSSTVQHPSVYYVTPGTFDVTLTVSNPTGSDSLTKVGYIIVNPITDPPVADFVADDTIIIIGESVSYTDLSTNLPDSWSWTFEGGAPSTGTEQNPAAITYDTPGIYSVTLEATNSFGTGTETKTDYITVTIPDYCNAGADGEYEYISNVQLGAIDNTTVWGAGGYEDYTDLSTIMEIGNPYILNVSIAQVYGTDQVLVWIDWNIDGDFDDTDENVFTASNLGQATYSISITPPSGASVGDTRMRIRLHDTDPQYSPNDTPCGNSGYGEIEDYTIAVQSGIPEIPVAEFTASVTEIYTGGSVDFTNLSAGIPDTWSWTFTGGTPSTSTEVNPANIMYNTAGTFTVELTVTNTMGTDTETKVGYITVTEAPDVIVYWDFPNNPDDSISDGGIPANDGTRFIVLFGGAVLSGYTNSGVTTQCASGRTWTSGMDTKGWETEFSTEGYESIMVSSKQAGNNTSSPRDFKLQYKIGTTGIWTDVTDGTVTCAVNNWTSGNLDELDLPASCNDRPSVFLRWIMTSNTSIGGGTIQNYRRNSIDDIFVTGYPLGTGITDKARSVQPEILVYPNPNKGHFSVRLTSDDAVTTVKITDITGQTVYSMETDGSNVLDVDIDAIAPGIYFISCTTGKGNYCRKFVVE